MGTQNSHYCTHTLSYAHREERAFYWLILEWNWQQIKQLWLEHLPQIQQIWCLLGGNPALLKLFSVDTAQLYHCSLPEWHPYLKARRGRWRRRNCTSFVNYTPPSSHVTCHCIWPIMLLRGHGTVSWAPNSSFPEEHSWKVQTDLSEFLLFTAFSPYLFYCLFMDILSHNVEFILEKI